VELGLGLGGRVSCLKFEVFGVWEEWRLVIGWGADVAGKWDGW
jgi:hypothetical protein